MDCWFASHPAQICSADLMPSLGDVQTRQVQTAASRRGELPHREDFRRRLSPFRPVLLTASGSGTANAAHLVDGALCTRLLRPGQCRRSQGDRMLDASSVAACSSPEPRWVWPAPLGSGSGRHPRLDNLLPHGVQRGVETEMTLYREQSRRRPGAADLRPRDPDHRLRADPGREAQKGSRSRSS